MDEQQKRHAEQIAAEIASRQLSAIIQREGVQSDPAGMDKQAHKALLYTQFMLNHLATLNARR